VLKMAAAQVTKLKLSNYGVILAENVSETLTSLKSDLMLDCFDGQVGLHRVILAPHLSSFSGLLKALKSNHMECGADETVHILLPDVSKNQAENLVKLLYSGSTDPISKCKIEELQNLTQLLKMNALPVSTVISSDKNLESFPRPELTAVVQVVQPKKQQRAAQIQPLNVENEAEISSIVRRSKRPKIKNKRLDDFETPNKGAEDETATTQSGNNFVQHFSLIYFELY
jgi:hypothetical protein